jgi:hypothetical protein
MSMPKTSRMTRQDLSCLEDFNSAGSGTIPNSATQAERVGGYWAAVEADLQKRFGPGKNEEGGTVKSPNTPT